MTFCNTTLGKLALTMLEKYFVQHVTTTLEMNSRYTAEETKGTQIKTATGVEELANFSYDLD